MSEYLENILAFISNKKFYGPIIAIFTAIIIYNFLIFILNKLMNKGRNELEIKRNKTIIILFQNILKWITWIVVILIVLEIFGVNTGSIVAGLGIAGVVIGLALQDTLKDFIAGITIIMDNSYVVGDTIDYKGFKGEVIGVGLRSTKIKKYTGEVQTVANRNIDAVINFSQKNSNQVFEISTEYTADIDKIEKAIEKMFPKIENIDNIIKNEAKYLGVTEVTDTKVKHMFTLKCKRMTGLEVRREVIKIVKKEFDKLKIKVTIL